MAKRKSKSRRSFAAASKKCPPKTAQSLLQQRAQSSRASGGTTKRPARIGKCKPSDAAFVMGTYGQLARMGNKKPFKTATKKKSKPHKAHAKPKKHSASKRATSSLVTKAGRRLENHGSHATAKSARKLNAARAKARREHKRMPKQRVMPAVTPRGGHRRLSSQSASTVLQKKHDNVPRKNPATTSTTTQWLSSFWPV